MIDKRCIKCNTAMAETRKRPYCKPCRNQQERIYYNAEKDRNRHLKYRYGITQEDYEKMFNDQQGICAICKKDSVKLVVDHCHKTNEVRGLLCYRCNLSLGLIESESDWIEAALEYVEYYKKAK